MTCREFLKFNLGPETRASSRPVLAGLEAAVAVVSWSTSWGIQTGWWSTSRSTEKSATASKSKWAVRRCWNVFHRQVWGTYFCLAICVNVHSLHCYYKNSIGYSVFVISLCHLCADSFLLSSKRLMGTTGLWWYPPSFLLMGNFLAFRLKQQQQHQQQQHQQQQQQLGLLRLEQRFKCLGENRRSKNAVELNIFKPTTTQFQKIIRVPL